DQPELKLMFSFLPNEEKLMRVLWFLAALVGAVGLFVVHAAAQIAPLRVEDVVAMHSFSEFQPITFSPDGKVVFYVVQDNRKRSAISLEDYWRTGVGSNGIGADIFAVQITTGSVTNLTDG